MKTIPTTAQILVFKMLGLDVDKRWTDWAYDMLCAGFETENLITLAGEAEPYNQFELRSLTDKVFKELNLRWDDREQVYVNYISYLITKALNGEIKPLTVLEIVRDLYLGDDYGILLQDFYMLYYAYDDLSYSDQQYYWNGATRSNIDSITKEYFKDWIAKYDSTKV